MALGCFVVWCSNGDPRRVFGRAVGRVPSSCRRPEGAARLRVFVRRHTLRRRTGQIARGPVDCRPQRSCRADRGNDAFSSEDKTCRSRLRRSERSRSKLKNRCSEQTDISPAAERRRPQRRRRALVAPPQRRLPRGERRRRPPTRVRRRKKETATGAVEPGQCTKGRGREAALRRRPATYWSRARIPGGGRARTLRVDP